MPARRSPVSCASRLFATRLALLALLAAPFGGCRAADPVMQVRDLHAEGRFEASLEPLRRLLDERPDDAEVQYLYGHALVGTQQLSLAQFALRKAMEHPEWRVPAGLELTSVALLTNNPEEAVATAGRILEAEPEHLDALLLRSQALAMSRHRYDEALADAERVLDLDPGSIEGQTLRAVSLLGLERIEDAEAALRELDRSAREEDLEPAEAARYCGMRAVFAKEKGDPEAATAIFGECLEDFPADPLVLQKALEFFDERRQPERNLEILRTALSEVPTAATFRRALAARLRQGGAVAEAEQVLREGTEMANPVLAVESWVDLASHYHALEDYPAAATALGRAVEIHATDDPQLVFDYADALVMAERYDEALEVASGLGASAHRALVEGRVALEQGRPAAALEQFGAALRLWPDNAVARYYAARAAEGVGDFERAIAEYRYSIRAEPSATDARLRLGRLHVAEGAASLALAVLQHDSARNPVGLEAELLELRVLARLGRVNEVRTRLNGFSARPGALGRAVAAAAEGVRERQGVPAAAGWLQGLKGFDFGDPKHSEALGALVADLAAAGATDEALAAASGALAKHPDTATFHAIYAQALAADEAGAETVRAAYARALELDPGSAAALSGLGELAAAGGDADAALQLYAKAAAADPQDASALVASAELLVSLGRGDEAERALEQALERRPYDAGAAKRLAELLLERGGDLERALGLAKRAVRFGGGPAAEALVARIQQQQGGAELAKRNATGSAASPPPAEVGSEP